MPVSSGERLDPDQTRQRILRAAEAAFYRNGVHAVGMSEVAARSGASKLSIYRHFGSKEGLVRDIAAARSARVLQWLRDGIAAYPPGRARIAGLYDLLGQWYAEEGFSGCGIVNTAVDTRDSRFTAAITANHLQAYRDILSDNVALEVPAADGDRVARQLLILIEGATLLAALTGDSGAAADARAAALAVLDSCRGSSRDSGR